jgi:hypothetical protein
MRAPKKFEKKNSCRDFSIGKIISWNKKKFEQGITDLKKLSTQAKNFEKIFVLVEKAPPPPSASTPKKIISFPTAQNFLIFDKISLH